MSANKDTPELEALFEQFQATAAPALTEQEQSPECPCGDNGHNQSEIYERIGSLARKLHDSLKEIGQGHALAHAKEHLPQDRERLAFVGQLMEQSATKVIDICEQQIPILEEQHRQLDALQQQWEQFLDGKLSLDAFKTLAKAQPQHFLNLKHSSSASKNSYLNILMAQDFQDLAGQTLSKIILNVQQLEQDLFQLLAFTAVESTKKEQIEGFLAGPRFSDTHHADILSSQEQVDDLLKDLGF